MRPRGLVAHVDSKFHGKAIHGSAGHFFSLRHLERTGETISVQSGQLRVEVGPHESHLEDRYGRQGTSAP